jgi:hypothetical protein
VHATLARLEEPRLANQRYVVSDNKRDEIGAMALGAKLERALGRRFSAQDASFTVPGSGRKEGEKKKSRSDKKKSISDEKKVVSTTA